MLDKDGANSPFSGYKGSDLGEGGVRTPFFMQWPWGKKCFWCFGSMLMHYLALGCFLDSLTNPINNFDKLKNNIYNLGLSSANITKIQLAKKIKKYIKDLNIRIIKNRKDPDKRDYYVSNRKIERHGFKAKVSLDVGIKELIKIFNYSDVKFKNNY